MIAQAIAQIESTLESAAHASWRRCSDEIVRLAGVPVQWSGEEELTVAFEGDTIAVRLDARRAGIGFFRDLGLLPQSDTASALRCLLALNHGGEHAPVRFGVHAASGRAVAALNLSLASLAADPAIARDALTRLSRAPRIAPISN